MNPAKKTQNAHSEIFALLHRWRKLHLLWAILRSFFRSYDRSAWCKATAAARARNVQVLYQEIPRTMTYKKTPPANSPPAHPSPTPAKMTRGVWVDYYFRGSRYRHRFKRAIRATGVPDKPITHYVFYTTQYTHSTAPTVVCSLFLFTLISVDKPAPTGRARRPL